MWNFFIARVLVLYVIPEKWAYIRAGGLYSGGGGYIWNGVNGSNVMGL